MNSLNSETLINLIVESLPFGRWSDVEDEMAADYGLFGNNNVKDRRGVYSMRAQSDKPIDRRIGRSMRTTGDETHKELNRFEEQINSLLKNGQVNEVESLLESVVSNVLNRLTTN